MKTRQVELYIGVSNGGDSGSWSTDYVDVPADTPDHKIGSLAVARMYTKLRREGAENIAFVGVYHIPPLDEDEEGS